jgi:hypothetical protein
MVRDYPAAARRRSARAAQSRPFVALPLPLIVVAAVRARGAEGDDRANGSWRAQPRSIVTQITSAPANPGG